MSNNVLAKFKNKITADKLLQTTFFRLNFVGTIPVGTGFDKLNIEEFDLYCQGTDLPGKTLTNLEIKKRGFTLRLPNVIEYSGEWKTSVLLNMSLSGYKALLGWQNAYSDLRSGLGGMRGATGVNAEVIMLNERFEEAGGAAGKLIIYDIFPKEVPAISMKHDTSESITVDVTFNYSYTNDFSADGADPLS